LQALVFDVSVLATSAFVDDNLDTIGRVAQAFGDGYKPQLVFPQSGEVSALLTVKAKELFAVKAVRSAVTNVLDSMRMFPLVYSRSIL